MKRQRKHVSKADSRIVNAETERGVVKTAKPLSDSRLVLQENVLETGCSFPRTTERISFRDSITMKLLLVLACLGASVWAGADQRGLEMFEMWTSGPRSAREDDAAATAHCPRGFHIKSCHWDIYQSDYDAGKLPDGVRLIDRAEGFECEAYNQAHGKGVRASAHCIKFLITVNSDDKKGDYEYRQPIATCPPGYKLLPAGCNLHSDTHHQSPLAAVVRNKQTCTTSADCVKCKVQARCYLDANSFTREVEFAPPIPGQLKYIGIVTD